MKNRLCQLLGIRYPVIQAGMVWVSDWRLACAASEAGILGTIGTGAMSMEEIGENIKSMKAATDRPFAVNIPLLRPDAVELVEFCQKEKVSIFITSAGNPQKLADIIKSSKNIWIHVVPSVRGAQKAVEAGADAVIGEGYEAGGHNSPYEITTLALIPQLADAVEVPVAGAGGIADGRGIAAVMALGADGAQLGTRFIATRECPAHEHYKQMIVEALDHGTCIVGRKLNMLRVLKNAFSDTMVEAENQGATREALLEIIGNEFNRNRAASLLGDLEEGAFQAGQSAGLIRDIPTVAELVERLIDEYEQAKTSLPSLGGSASADPLH